MNSRERVLKVFKREPVDCAPVFSGHGNITVHGLEKYGWRFCEIHSDAEKMARVAATSYELFGRYLEAGYSVGCGAIRC